MEKGKLKVNLNIEATIADKISEFVQEIKSKTGVRVERITVNWIPVFGSGDESVVSKVDIEYSKRI